MFNCNEKGFPQESNRELVSIAHNIKNTNILLGYMVKTWNTQGAVRSHKSRKHIVKYQYKIISK